MLAKKFLESRKKLFLPPLVGLALTLSIVGIVTAHGGDVSKIHACVSNLTGVTKIVGVNDGCAVNETALDWIKDVIAGTGLTSSSSSNGVTLSLATGGVATSHIADNAVTTPKLDDAAVTAAKLLDGAITAAKLANNSVTTSSIVDDGVTTAKLANGSVTPDKISNDASEASRIQTWVDNTTDYSFTATGSPADHTITSGITLTIPTGKAYNYIVTYGGGFLYNYSERASEAFYGDWSAKLLANTTPVSTSISLIQTGQRQSWSAFGNNSYWRTPFHATWLIRLTEGTHTLKVVLNGYSDNTMNQAHFQYNNLQVVRVF